jgi:hypothetical protein
MINILGDITVRSVKIKDKLTPFNWRISSYFIYERFYYERTKLLEGLKNSNKNVIRRHHKHI